MVRPSRPIVLRTCALALWLCAWSPLADTMRGQDTWTTSPISTSADPLWSSSEPMQPAGAQDSLETRRVSEGQDSLETRRVSEGTSHAVSTPLTYESGFRVPLDVESGLWDGTTPTLQPVQTVERVPAPTVDETWITAPTDRTLLEPEIYGDPGWEGQTYFGGPADDWHWQILPDGLIYHSYWAGVREPRLSLVLFDERGRNLWDGTLGGRVGLLRYGTRGAYFPQGWQLDVEAAALARLTLDEIRDFETADYRVGIPLTYGIENWQFKLAIYHLSSHLGDEFAIANPGSLDERINYVRDALVLGASFYPHPFVRLYSEAAYAFNVDGGAKPWEFQFGTELSKPGPTGMRGTPFFAANAHLREEHDFGGDINTQAGWLWRGESAQVLRIGLHYFNGKSSQYQTFDDSEEQIGFGLWYDY